MNFVQPVNKTAYNTTQNKLLDKLSVKASKVMTESAERLYNKVLTEEPDNAVVNNEHGILAHVKVTVDGTWQRRGHCSKIGVVFVISSLTGEVLDYEVKSLFCHQCKSIRRKYKLNNTLFDQWYDRHKDVCKINHSGSSDSMECDAAKSIFLRSIDQYKLVYSSFIGDGDSSSFGNVAKACLEKYGPEYTVKKEECVGHVQKRMGSRLRNLKKNMKGKKLSDGVSIGGRGRLTDKTVDKIQNFYGQAIRANPGDLKGMVDSIWAIYYHMIKGTEMELPEQHQYCPKGDASWCKYWSNRESYDESRRLAPVFLEVLKPIFKDLTDENLLGRCMLGLTQNQNEAINSVLWSKCLKTKFAGKAKVQLAVCDTVCEFNLGNGCKAEVIEELVGEVGVQTLSGLQYHDRERILNSQRKVTGTSRITRRKRRADKKSKGDPVKTTYLTGAFGTGTEPELDSSIPSSTGTEKESLKFIRDKDVIFLQLVDADCESGGFYRPDLLLKTAQE